MWRCIIVGSWLSGVSYAAPAPPTLTDSELSDLAGGSVVIRPPPTPTGEAVAIVDIEARPEQIWAVITDFQARVDSVSVLESIDVYAPETDPKGLGATFHLKILGSDVIYHLRYAFDRPGNYCTFTLDPEREHDIVTVKGSYQLVPLSEGRNRLVYRSQTDTGRYVPGFIQKMLTNDSLKSQLEEMRRRAPTK